MNPCLIISVYAAVFAAAPIVKPVPGGLASTVLSFERIPLPETGQIPKINLRADTLSAMLEIDAPGAKNYSNLIKHLTQFRSELCPVIEETSTGARLLCRTHRFEANLSTDRTGKRFIDVYGLRGLPTRPGFDGPPQFFYDPEKLDLGGPCPGTTASSRGECAFIAGDLVKAAQNFKEAFATRPSFAALRLGDLALLAGDPEIAIAWYKRGRLVGVFGRLAIARECELTGSCFSRLAPAFEAAGLPEPVRTEMELRRIRALMLVNKGDEAIRRLLERLSQPNRLPACEGSVLELCKSIVFSALRDKNAEYPALAIAAYVALPKHDTGPRAIEIAEAAADLSERLGAPGFGASLLAATASQATSAALSDHLAHTAELYIAAKDRTRARAIVDYAKNQLSPRHLAGTRWKAIVEAMTSAEVTQPPVPARQIEQNPELAQAEQALARARLLRTTEAR